MLGSTGLYLDDAVAATTFILTELAHPGTWHGMIMAWDEASQEVVTTNVYGCVSAVACLDAVNRIVGTSHVLPYDVRRADAVYADTGDALTATVGYTHVVLCGLSDDTYLATIYGGGGIVVKTTAALTLPELTAKVNRWLDLRIDLPPVGWTRL